MSSKTKKGDQAEYQAKAELEKDGWIVHRAGRKARYIGKGKLITEGHDIFGADLVARKAECNTKWINVTTIENKSAKIKEFAKYTWGPREDVEIWCKVPRKGWRKFQWDHWDNWKEIE